jgi:hypothetical protein
MFLIIRFATALRASQSHKPIDNLPFKAKHTNQATYSENAKANRLSREAVERRIQTKEQE